MAIQNARSNTSGNAPTSLQDGQIAINQADDVLFSRKPDGTIRRALLPKRYGVADAAFTVRAFDTYIGVASLTASRTITMPAAANYPAGQPLTISDESGACSPSVALTMAAAGSDKIDGASTMALTAAYGALILVSDGASKWTVIAQPAAGAANAVLYVPQTILPGQQLLARQNIGARGGGVVAKSAAYTVTGSDIGRLLSCSGTFVLTLTAAATLGNGFSVEVRNAGGGTITVTPNGSETINGAGTLTLATGQAATLLCDGTQWFALLHIYTPPTAPSTAPTVTAYSTATGTGYRKMSDGFLMQWGTTTVTGNSAITYPLSFPSACRAFTGNVQYGDGTNAFTLSIDPPGQSSCGCHVEQISNGGAVSFPSISVSWIAVGF